MATILVIDDEEQVRTLFQLALERADYRVLGAASGQHGLALLQHEAVDLIIVDIHIPDMDVLEFTQLLRQTRPATKIIAMTGGSGLWDCLDIAKYLGMDSTLKKPFSMVELVKAVASQLI